MSHSLRRVRRVPAAVALAVPVIMLSACGSSSGSADPSSAASQEPTPSSTSTASVGAAGTITFTMNDGTVVVTTNPKAPRTVAAMTKLAGDQYFDGTVCHRVVTQGIYVLQCGDPTGTGTGGPGYTLPDENLPAGAKDNYPAGTVAMANAGPNTGGSQFFIVYKDSTLPPNYTVWGEVTEGLDVVKAIGAAAAKAQVSDGPPPETVTIETATAG